MSIDQAHTHDGDRAVTRRSRHAGTSHTRQQMRCSSARSASRSALRTSPERRYCALAFNHLAAKKAHRRALRALAAFTHGACAQASVAATAPPIAPSGSGDLVSALCACITGARSTYCALSVGSTSEGRPRSLEKTLTRLDKTPQQMMRMLMRMATTRMRPPKDS